MPNKTKQINIRVSEEVFNALKSEANKQKITLTKLCCQGINLLIATLYSAEINNSLKKTCASQLVTSSLENSTSVISSLDFEMSQLQELENRISNVERALVRLFGAIPNQINDLAISSESKSRSTKDSKTYEETTEPEETLYAPTNHKSDGKDTATVNSTGDTANTRSSRKTKGDRVFKAQDSPSEEEPLMIPSKSGRLVCCPHCRSSSISKNGHDKYGQQMYRCKNCRKITTLKHGNTEVGLNQ